MESDTGKEYIIRRIQYGYVKGQKTITSIVIDKDSQTNVREEVKEILNENGDYQNLNTQKSDI
jgi:type III secretory pathway component EscV